MGRHFRGIPKRTRRRLWFLKTARGWQRLVWLWGRARAVKKGSRVSRFLRGVFEVRFIRTMIGTAVVVSFLTLVLVRESVGGAFGLGSVGGGGEETGDSVVVLTQRGVTPPLASVKVNQKFWFGHKGVDLDGETGDLVRPVSDGVVEEVNRWKYAYGNHIVVNHGSGFRSLYGHLSRVEVRAGDRVGRETVIGRLGSTGWSSGPHLHLEFVVNGDLVNPMQYL